jgi:hypothetical protein
MAKARPCSATPDGAGAIEETLALAGKKLGDVGFLSSGSSGAMR